MEMDKDFTSISPATINVQSFLIQLQQPSTIPFKVQEQSARIGNKTVAGQRVFRVLFLVHLFLIAGLVVFLTVHGLISAKNHRFHSKKWFPPLLSATLCGGIVGFVWQWLTIAYPSRAVRLAFWVNPLLTFAIGVLLLLISSAASLALGAISIVFGLAQSLYGCWSAPRFDYAVHILSVSAAFPPVKSTILVALLIFTGIFFSGFLVSGIAGASAARPGIDILLILVMLGSLAWTMQVIKNILHVTISRLKYLNFVFGVDMEMRIAVRDTIKHLMGSVCIGSMLVPVLTVIRSSARGIGLIVGGTDEFLFSCVNCYSAVASALIAYGNRWGFVQVGAYNKGFVQASMDTWEMFRKLELVPLIDSDLTGSFCFFCGTAGGSICALVAGIWGIAVHKDYATEVSIYAFLIGYFMSRIAMALPQACVSAYYISYAENPHNPRFDSTIPDRIQEIQRYQQQAYQ